MDYLFQFSKPLLKSSHPKAVDAVMLVTAHATATRKEALQRSFLVMLTVIFGKKLQG